MQRKVKKKKKKKFLLSFSREKRVALLATDLGVLTVSTPPFSVCVSKIGISLEADCGDEWEEQRQLDKLKRKTQAQTK